MHYVNMPTQYTAIFMAVKSENYDQFLIFAQNIDCGYTLELPHCSNGYPQSMF